MSNEKILYSNEVFFRHWKGKPPVFRNLHHGPQPLLRKRRGKLPDEHSQSLICTLRSVR